MGPVSCLPLCVQIVIAGQCLDVGCMILQFFSSLCLRPGIVEVYRCPFPADSSVEPSSDKKQVFKCTIGELARQICVSPDIVTITVVDDEDGGNPSVVVANWKTGRHTRIRIPFPRVSPIEPHFPVIARCSYDS